MILSSLVLTVLSGLAGWCGLGHGGLAPHAPVDALHPQDGPDADVRIHVEASRVRFYIMLNLAFVDEVVDLYREDDSRLHPAEFASYRAGLLDYFHDTNRVLIDGLEVAPVDAGFESMDADLSFLPLFPRMGERALAKVQLVLDYPVKSPPNSVQMYWGSYPPDRAVGDENFMPTVTIRAQLFSNGIQEEAIFKQEEPEFTWHNSGETAADHFFKVPEPPAQSGWPMPVGSLVLLIVGGAAALMMNKKKRHLVAVATSLGVVGVAWFARGFWVVEMGVVNDLPSAAEAEEIFLPLHANIYRAFDYTAESDIYDALAQSVDGPLLDTLYNQVYRGLIMQEEGGAVSRVMAVRPVEMAVESIGIVPDDGRPGFDVLARWQVDGKVTHWGHSHERTNEYQARYTVLQTEQGWRIGGSQVQEQSRVSATPEGG
jgi:hypothetical protein